MQQSLPELMFTNAENETLVRIDCNNSFLNIPSEWQIDMEVSGDCPAAGDYFEDYARPAGGLMGGTRITCNPNGNGGRDRRLMDFVAVNQEQLLYCADPPIAIDANMPPYRVSIFVKTPIWNQNGRNYFFRLRATEIFPLNRAALFRENGFTCRRTNSLVMFVEFNSILQFGDT